MSRYQEDCKLKRVDVILDLTNAEMAIYQAIESKDWKLAREGSYALFLVFAALFALFVAQGWKL